MENGASTGMLTKDVAVAMALGGHLSTSIESP